MLTNKEIELIKGFLTQYSDILSCEGCNDWNFPSNWNVTDRKDLLEYMDCESESEAEDWVVVNAMRSKLDDNMSSDYSDDSPYRSILFGGRDND